MLKRTAPYLLGAVLLTVCLVGCASPGNAPNDAPQAALTAGEGFIDVPGGRVWYRISGSGTATPLLLLHGGPGAPAYYLESLEALADERPVVLYDQLGCGRSDKPDDSSLWIAERFVAELEQVRETLGLDEVHLLGQSWGTMLAVEYLATRRPEGIRSLILASPALSIPRWTDDANRLRAELPEQVQAVMARHEEAGTVDSEEYMQASMEFYRRHVCRLDPWPDAVQQTFDELAWDVYGSMWGPSEFHATGNLEDFDRTADLATIAVPTLFTAGRYDEATPESTAWYQSLVPGAELVIFENSSHMAHLEEEGLYIEVVRDFLRRVEKNE